MSTVAAHQLELLNFLQSLSRTPTARPAPTPSASAPLPGHTGSGNLGRTSTGFTPMNARSSDYTQYENPRAGPPPMSRGPLASLFNSPALRSPPAPSTPNDDDSNPLDSDDTSSFKPLDIAHIFRGAARHIEENTPIGSHLVSTINAIQSSSNKAVPNEEGPFTATPADRSYPPALPTYHGTPHQTDGIGLDRGFQWMLNSLFGSKAFPEPAFDIVKDDPNQPGTYESTPRSGE